MHFPRTLSLRQLGVQMHAIANDVEKRGYRILLWVDQLCIIQDDEVEKRIQLEQMGYIFRGSLATIFTTEGTHSNIRLARQHPDKHDPACEGDWPVSVTGISSSGQAIKNIGGLRLVAALPTIDSVMDKCKWNTRAWTFQEAELSHNAIIFTEHQVFYRCSQDIFQEDVFTEEPPTVDDSEPNSRNSLSIGLRQLPLKLGDWPRNFEFLSNHAQIYVSA